MSYVMSTNANTSQAYLNEQKVIEMGGRTYYVNKYGICSTPIVDYSVYEACETSKYHAFYDHSTITYQDGVCLGDITTRELPEDIEALKPGSDERIRAVVAWHDGNKAVAKAIVLVAYPQDF